MRPPYWLQKRTPAGPETEVFFRLALLMRTTKTAVCVQTKAIFHHLYVF